MKRVKWGIVGAGRIARSFAHDLQFVGNSHLTAIASRSKDSAKSFASEYGIKHTFDDYQALFLSPEVDAVYIATPHALHLEHARDALHAGKAVLCEKPLNTNLSETNELIQTAHSINGYLIEGMWTFFLPAIRKALSWYREGKIGALRHIKVDFGYPQLPYSPTKREYASELGGGALLEMGIYPVALAWLFTGQDPLNIQTHASFAPNGVEDDLVSIFEYESYVATLGTSFRCKLQNWAYIIGEDGYIAIPDFWRASECHRYELDACIETFKDDRKGFGFEYEATAVADDIRAGKRESTVVPHSWSRKFQEHMQRIRESFVVIEA